MAIMAIFRPNQSHLVDISIFCPWKGINNNNNDKKEKSRGKKWCGRERRLSKYFNCLLRFGGHHNRSIWAVRRTLKRRDPDGSIEEAGENQLSDGEKSTAYLSIHSWNYLLHVDVAYVCALVSERTCVRGYQRGGRVQLMCLWVACIDLESERRLFSPVALTEDRILWTAHKVCNEYLSLFIFAGLRYFNVSSAFSLRATRTRHVVPTHAIVKGGEGGQVAFALQWALFICACPSRPIKQMNFEWLHEKTARKVAGYETRPLDLSYVLEVKVAVRNIIWKILQLSSSSNRSLSFIWFAFYWALCSWELQPNKKQS